MMSSSGIIRKYYKKGDSWVLFTIGNADFKLSTTVLLHLSQVNWIPLPYDIMFNLASPIARITSNGLANIISTIYKYMERFRNIQLQYYKYILIVTGSSP